VRDPGEEAPATALGTSRRVYGVGWKTAAALALAALIVAGVAFHFVREMNLRGRLMRADPDAIAGITQLREFAVALGRRAYARHCASCHGAQMQGDRSRGAPNLADSDWLYGEGRTAQIENTILHGIRSGDPKGWNQADMPAFAEPVPYKRTKITPLGPGEISDVVEFLLVRAGKPGEAVASARGSEIFFAKGQCFDCHATDAKGDAAIGAPSLVDDIWVNGDGSREDIFYIVAHGSSGFCPAWAGRLDAATVRGLAVLVYLASHPRWSRAASPATGGAQEDEQNE
jgi:cytochrome c oxidase cbb3-type subunit III